MKETYAVVKSLKKFNQHYGLTFRLGNAALSQSSFPDGSDPSAPWKKFLRVNYYKNTNGYNWQWSGEGGRVLPHYFYPSLPYLIGSWAASRSFTIIRLFARDLISCYRRICIAIRLHLFRSILWLKMAVCKLLQPAIPIKFMPGTGCVSAATDIHSDQVYGWSWLSVGCYRHLSRYILWLKPIEYQLYRSKDIAQPFGRNRSYLLRCERLSRWTVWLKLQLKAQIPLSLMGPTAVDSCHS